MNPSWIWKNSKIYKLFEPTYRNWKRGKVIKKLKKEGYVIPKWCMIPPEQHIKDPCYGMSQGYVEREGELYCLTSCGFHKKGAFKNKDDYTYDRSGCARPS